MKDNYYIIDYIYRNTHTFEIYTKENFFKKIVSTPHPVYICESYEIKDGLFTFMGKKSYDIGLNIYNVTENEFKNSDYIKNIVLKNNQCFEITTSIKKTWIFTKKYYHIKQLRPILKEDSSINKLYYSSFKVKVCID